MSAQDEVEDLLQRADGLREKLLDERKELLTRLEQLDALLLMLPGTRPISIDGLRTRRRLHASAIGRAGQPINSRDVLHATATFYSIEVSTLTGPARVASIARARHVAAYLARKLTSESFPELGMAFGGRDHTTIIDAVRKIDEQLALDAELRAEVEELEKAIREAQAVRAAPVAASAGDAP